MKLKITKSDKKALLAALAVCGIGILFSFLIVLGVDIYRKHTYTSVILPDAYRITDMKCEGAHLLLCQWGQHRLRLHHHGQI